jgi:beta-glucanase (GH16 family)
VKGKADTSSYDRMVYVPVANNQKDYHTYGLNWTSAAITWMVDGAPVRTLKYADAKGGTRFPQTPMRLRVGIWAAPAGSPGIIEWAGGLADPTKGPYTMTADSFNIVNYSPGKEYRYKDNTGNWDSIEVIGGSAGGIVAPGQDTTPSSSKLVAISTASTMIPVNPLPTSLDTKTGGSSPYTVAITSVAKPASTLISNATAATASAVVTKSSNATNSTSKPTATPSASAKAATTNAGSVFGATSAAIAGLSLLFLAFLA